MANKASGTKAVKENTNIGIKKKSKAASVLKMLLVLIIVLMLVAVGFAVGIYLKLFDVDNYAAKWNLSSYPVIGKYFPQQTTNFDTVDLDENGEGKLPITNPLPTVNDPALLSDANAIADNAKIDYSELQKREILKKKEEAKQISKLSRLYGEMKPDDAVAILNNMDDNTVVAILSKMEEDQAAKILSLFDNRRAAILTQMMLKGKNPNQP